ncbi:hypothetical protein ACJIZ3_023704 [Penstemon smallii]|uniref:HMA domain-containing protein n=1 Tax=Penstemon smallii TaxID=265156 RepID=A0ABD3TS91_9LAMI
MGEEEIKKPDEEEKVVEPPKPEVEKPTSAVAEEKKEEKKPEAEQPPPPPPPPPQEIILKVYMHCEGCARKVRRCLKGFEGVEDVITDCRTSKVIVKGEKADPLKVLERVQKKSHRQAELISPVPKPTVEEPNKTEEKEVVKIEEKKEEPPVVTVVLGVYMHCGACAQEIKKRIQKMKGVESAEPDLKSSQVTVKGVIEPEKLTDYVYKRTGKHAVIIKAETEKKAEEKGKEDKKAEEGEKEAKKGEEGGNEKKESGGGGGADGGSGGGEPSDKPEVEAEDSTKLELKKNEFYHHYHPQNYQVYPQRFVQDMYSYPPQMFSDENPNACSVM